MPQQYKIDKVAEIESRIAENAGLFVVNYNGLTVKQAQELRHQLRECGAEMKVYKNNLVKIALKNQEQPEIDEILAGPTAITFVKGDFIEAAKTLRDFAKTNKALVISGGYADGTVYDGEGATKLADMMSRPQLLSKFAGDLKATTTKAAYLFVAVPTKAVRTIDALREKQEKAA